MHDVVCVADNMAACSQQLQAMKVHRHEVTLPRYLLAWVVLLEGAYLYKTQSVLLYRTSRRSVSEAQARARRFSERGLLLGGRKQGNLARIYSRRQRPPALAKGRIATDTFTAFPVGLVQSRLAFLASHREGSKARP